MKSSKLLYLWIALLAGLAVFAVIKLTAPNHQETMPRNADTCMNEAVQKDLEHNYERGLALFRAAATAHDYMQLPLARRLELKRIAECRPEKAGNDYFKELVWTGGLGRWDKNQLKIYIDPELKDEGARQVRSACRQWATALEGKINWQEVADAGAADIIFTRLQNETNLGEAAQAVTCFSALPASVSSVISRSRKYVVQLPRIDELGEDTRAIANQTYLHEVGHALGLQGHSVYADDAMYCESKVQGLSPRDVGTIKLLYKGDFKTAEELAQSALAQAVARQNSFALLTAADLQSSPAAKVDLLRASAAAGSADAQARLGLAYELGEGLPEDKTQARIWYKKAAQQDSPEGITRLAQAFENAVGGAADLPQALELYRKAADLGYAPAQFLLATAYEQGKGVAKDETRAAQLYESASLQDYPPAHIALAQLLATGRGVSQDFAAAADLYKRAAETGDKNAQVQLGLIYYHGSGLPKNREAAIKCWERAAEQGSAEATRYLRAARK